MNKFILISLIILVTVGIGVSRVKYEVVFLRKHLKTMNEEIEKLEDDIKIHTAEWSYLNNPKRLKMLAAKYLKNMKPIEKGQIISLKKFTSSEVVEINRQDAFKMFLDGALGKSN